MHIFRHKPSVLFVKTTHIHVLQSVAVQVRAGFCLFHVYGAQVYLTQDVGEDATSELPRVARKRCELMYVGERAACVLHQSPVSDFRFVAQVHQCCNNA